MFLRLWKSLGINILSSGYLSSRIKRPKPGADYSPSIADVNNAWNCVSIPPLPLSIVVLADWWHLILPSFKHLIHWNVKSLGRLLQKPLLHRIDSWTQPTTGDRKGDGLKVKWRGDGWWQTGNCGRDAPSDGWRLMNGRAEQRERVTRGYGQGGGGKKNLGTILTTRSCNFLQLLITIFYKLLQKNREDPKQLSVLFTHFRILPVSWFSFECSEA
jgi:hypothetical protein